MKKIIFGLTAALLLTCGPTQAQELPPNVTVILPDKAEENPAPVSTAPRFRALSEPDHHAGEVEAPGAVNREFSFVNEGDAPLEIKEVRSGCGCLVTSYDPLIPPGARSAISISMKIYPEWNGREVSRTTWVITNDPINSQIRLTTSAVAKAGE